MRVVFVSGPFRAASVWGMEENIRKAERVALEIWCMGAAVICPHANTRYFQGEATDDLWLKGDLAILERCDAMVLVPGWELSAGARDEYGHAARHEIPVYEWGKLEDRVALRRWIDAVSGH